MLRRSEPVGQIQRDHGIVGRADELAMALAVLRGGRHLLLEGPVGVGKTTVALAVCAHLGRGVVRVDGDDRYSESKLTGWFDPPLVLAKGYSDETFFAGPLVQAMRTGLPCCSSTSSTACPRPCRTCCCRRSTSAC